jgi:4-amino-4-deoxy-L-arabinose transferase-like glycosyltransferase
VEGAGSQSARAELSSPKYWRALLLIVAASIGLRIGYVLTVTQHDHGFYDAAFYENEARSIADGRGVVYPLLSVQARRPAADHPPLTVLALVPAAALPGTSNSRLWMRFTMVAFGAIVVLLVGLLGRLLAGRRVGLTAAVIAAVYANLWMNDGLLMSETIAALTTIGAIVLAYHYLRRPSWGLAVALGIVCGLAALTRAELLLLVVLLAIPAAWATRGGTAHFLGTSAVVLVGFGLVVAPWVGFNLSRFQQPTFISTGDGVALLGASCATSYHGALQGLWAVNCLPAEAPSADESTVNLEYRDQATSYIRGHLSELPVVVLARFGRLLGVDDPSRIASYNAREGRPRWASYVGIVSFLLLVPFAIGGFVWLRRRRVRVWPLLAPVWVVLVSAALFYGTPRFRAPAEPIIVVLAAVGACALVAGRRPWIRSGTRAAVASESTGYAGDAASPAGPAI